MRCSASPTISTAAEPAPPRLEDVAQALLFREILKPLENALGPVGSLALEAATEALFVRPRA